MLALTHGTDERGVGHHGRGQTVRPHLLPDLERPLRMTAPPTRADKGVVSDRVRRALLRLHLVEQLHGLLLLLALVACADQGRVHARVRGDRAPPHVVQKLQGLATSLVLGVLRDRPDVPLANGMTSPVRLATLPRLCLHLRRHRHWGRWPGLPAAPASIHGPLAGRVAGEALGALGGVCLVGRHLARLEPALAHLAWVCVHPGRPRHRQDRNHHLEAATPEEGQQHGGGHCDRGTPVRPAERKRRSAHRMGHESLHARHREHCEM
mmetsp:Transcript_96407/g.254622  ORF Transcript_96407/g.254622 Transcript_96407/m.254622 type:complete len:266 (+) Transcript_96407:1467-2264(+)